ncbi:hypothetical protein ACFOPN_18755 [Xanthomonas hyacinthi]|uniref:hypothetical protein n=1 Tax=Xanthomonas hyacinthi TaxID=56455 RepID=UPI000A93F81D
MDNLAEAGGGRRATAARMRGRADRAAPAAAAEPAHAHDGKAQCSAAPRPATRLSHLTLRRPPAGCAGGTSVPTGSEAGRRPTARRD